MTDGQSDAQKSILSTSGQRQCVICREWFLVPHDGSYGLQDGKPVCCKCKEKQQ